jgi:hypothetical protein
MSSPPFLTGLGWIGVWLAGLVVSSLGYRLARGKPILFFSVKDAQFIERMASGQCLRPWWRRLGHADNCLVVAVARGRLIVRPIFPFTLMFLPELAGLDFEIPLERITSVSEDPGFFSTRLLVEFTRSDGVKAELALRVRRMDDLFKLLVPKTR